MHFPGERETAELAGDLPGNRPRMSRVVTREDVLREPARGVAPEVGDVMQREVIVAGGVLGARDRAVIAERAQSAGGQLEMMNGGARLEPDRAAGHGDAHREVGLEAIRGADEVLVEAADLQRARAIDGEIA